MLSVKQLSAFIMVAERGSISKAAEQLYVSQPALTQQMNHLENALGFKLFIRAHNGITLTRAGHSFYKDAKDIMERLENAVEWGRKAAGLEQRVVRIGINQELGSVLIFDICKKFSAHNPEIRIEIVPTHFDTVIHDLEKGMFDLCECYAFDIEESSRLRFLPLIADQLCMLVPENHRLIDKKLLKVSDLYHETLIIANNSYSKGIRNFVEYIVEQELPIGLFKQDMDGVFYLKCCINGYLAITTNRFSSNCPDLIPIPLEWDKPVHIGILYADKQDATVKRFLDAAASMQGEAAQEGVAGL